MELREMVFLLRSGDLDCLTWNPACSFFCFLLQICWITVQIFPRFVSYFPLSPFSCHLFISRVDPDFFPPDGLCPHPPSDPDCAHNCSQLFGPLGPHSVPLPGGTDSQLVIINMCAQHCVADVIIVCVCVWEEGVVSVVELLLKRSAEGCRVFWLLLNWVFHFDSTGIITYALPIS